MSITTESRKAFLQLRRDSVKYLRRKLKEKNKYATGRTYKSIRGKITLSFSRNTLDIYADPSIIYIDRGRKAGGKFPPKQPIEEWVRAKNIKPRDGISQASLVYLIRRKIARDGIKPTPIFHPFSMFLVGKTTRALQKAYQRDLNSTFLRGVKPLVDNAAELSLK